MPTQATYDSLNMQRSCTHTQVEQDRQYLLEVIADLRQD